MAQKAETGPEGPRQPNARVVFFGTPEFAVPTLRALHGREDVEVVGVLCQPDRPKGRDLALTPPPVKSAALELGLPVTQPTRLKDGAVAAWLRATQVDLAVVIAYGRILPPDVLAAPRLGCVNLHASLLPRWRGAAPIQRAIQAGDARTGVSLMQMDAGLDTGPELARMETAVATDDTAATLAVRLADLSAALLMDQLTALLAEALIPVAQPDVGITWAPPLQKHEGMLDLSAPARQLRDLLRAMTPWPGGQLQVGAEVWKVFAEGTAVVEAEAAPGTLLAIDGEHCVLATGAGGLLLTELQRPGRRRMGAGSALRGARIEVGSRLGLPAAAPLAGGGT